VRSDWVLGSHFESHPAPGMQEHLTSLASSLSSKLTHLSELSISERKSTSYHTREKKRRQKLDREKIEKSEKEKSRVEGLDCETGRMMEK
jgi:hypothetical protein